MLHAIFVGTVGAKLDAVLAVFSMAPRFTDGGHGAEVVCGLLGIAVVLAASAIDSGGDS